MDKTATHVLGRECSDKEISRFEAFNHALAEDDIEEAARLLDEFPEADRALLVELTGLMLEAAPRPRTRLAPVPKGRSPHPDEPAVAMDAKRVAVSVWGGDDEVEAAVRGVLKAACRQRGRSRSPVRAAPRRRREITRSSSRSGDSGSEDGEPEPSSPRRFCAHCNKDIPADRSPRAKYCCDQHADRDRQRRKRQRDRARAQLPRIPTTADFRRMLEIADEDMERLRELVVCRCNGRHLELELGECFRCGHWLPKAGWPA